MTAPLITNAGAYADISAEDYHRNPNLLPGPSLSSSGGKTIIAQSPYHFWHDSPMNPNRPPEKGNSPFAFGKAAHDRILLGGDWATRYHALPEGFAWNKTKAMAEEIAEAGEARDAGKTLLKHGEMKLVQCIADAIEANPTAMATLTGGVTEETLVWQDPVTGVWLRARPDFRPDTIKVGHRLRVVSDLKFMAPTHCTPEGFGKSIANFGYHQSAAFYADGLRAIYGHYPTHWVHVVVEKPADGVKPEHAPLSVSLYELPAEDIERGRLLNRRAINLFADCLEKDRWPSYAADEPRQVGLPFWARNQIDDATPEEYATADASKQPELEGTD